ncbi:MAG: sugar phosphate isomerase/epimerase [Clostridia bacterium]|nr:sugar phosphate isomerase/epimerase [Clostridia bacterium]
MQVILGVNHQFLYPAAMTDARAHTESLKKLAATDKVQALDCWLWRGETAAEEKKILLDSGKIINYNIGDRFGEEISLPSSRNAADRARAYDLMMREITYALEVGSKKIVFGSGPDDVNDHMGAQERFAELILRVASQLPDDVSLSFEPTDWDIDKHFLFGPLSETVDFIKQIRHNGFVRIGLLLDMCHVPIIHETLESAIDQGGEVLNHIHLGNCIIKNPNSPFYGDKHIPWSYPESEYTEQDGIRFIHMLKEIGYLGQKNATVSFEMRPYEGVSAEESLARFVEVWKSAFEVN